MSFVASDPTLAMKITDRLSILMVNENMRWRAMEADTTIMFIRGQIDDLRQRIIAYEKSLEELRAQRGQRALSQADLLPYEVLQDRYKSLLIMSEEASMAWNLERRQVGEQYKVFDSARMPERPVGPSRLRVNVAGTLVGLSLGLVFVGVRGRSKETSGKRPLE